MARSKTMTMTNNNDKVKDKFKDKVKDQNKDTGKGQNTEKKRRFRTD